MSKFLFSKKKSGIMWFFPREYQHEIIILILSPLHTFSDPYLLSSIFEHSPCLSYLVGQEEHSFNLYLKHSKE